MTLAYLPLETADVAPLEEIVTETTAERDPAAGDPAIDPAPRPRRRRRWLVRGLLLLFLLVGWVLWEIWPLYRASRNVTGAARTAHRELVVEQIGGDVAASESTWKRMEELASVLTEIGGEVNVEMKERGLLEGVTYGEFFAQFGDQASAHVELAEGHSMDDIMHVADLDWSRIVASDDLAAEPAVLVLQHLAAERDLMSLLEGLGRSPPGLRPPFDPEEYMIAIEFDSPMDAASPGLILTTLMRSQMAGEDPTAWRTVLAATLAIARTQASQGLTLPYFTGLQLKEKVLLALRRECKSGHLRSDDLQEILRLLEENELPPPEFWIECDRLAALDLFEWAFTDDGKGHGYLIPPGLNCTRRDSADLLACLPCRFLLASRSESETWLSTRVAELVARLQTPLAERPPSRWPRLGVQEGVILSFEFMDPWMAVPFRPLSVPLPRGERKYVQLEFMTGTLEHLTDGYSEIEVQIEGTRTMLLLEIHRSLTGSFPAALDLLAPELREQLRPDPISGKPFAYRVDGPSDSYFLYSIGADGRDDGGDFDISYDESGFALPTPDIPIHAPPKER